MERERTTWRERYLDRSSSPLWDVIDRARFEHLISDRASKAERIAKTASLYQAVTALAYEEDLATWVDAPADSEAEPLATGNRSPQH